MIELLSTETKPVYIGYNKLAADVAEATTDALTGADYIALQATIKYLWFMVILLAGRRTARIGGGGHRQRTRRQAGQATQRNTAWL